MCCRSILDPGENPFLAGYGVNSLDLLGHVGAIDEAVPDSVPGVYCPIRKVFDADKKTCTFPPCPTGKEQSTNHPHKCIDRCNYDQERITTNGKDDCKNICEKDETYYVQKCLKKCIDDGDCDNGYTCEGSKCKKEITSGASCKELDANATDTTVVCKQGMNPFWTATCDSTKICKSTFNGYGDAAIVICVMVVFAIILALAWYKIPKYTKLASHVDTIPSAIT